jgi:DNA-binding response OmpR family regulator
MSVKITIIDQNEASRQQLTVLLARENIVNCEVLAEAGSVAGVCLWIGEKDQKPPGSLKMGENDRFTRPVRVGAVLDRVRRLQAMAKDKGRKIAIGSFELDVHSNEILLAEDRAVRLTDKEKEILVLLNEAKSEAVGREALLEKVWGYASNLDTHTLETHIYRLRQKIERDPAKPEILLTDGAGYKIVT